jgi:hypothetical protein
MRRLPILLALAAAACTSQLPPGTTEFSAGRTTVRVDSALDLVGAVFRLADTAAVPPVGPARRWLTALTTELGDSTFALARDIGAAPVGAILENYGAGPAAGDSACGLIAPGTRRCFAGNVATRQAAQRFIAAARGFAPRASSLALEGLNGQARRRDLSDVYTALTGGKALDSAVAAYSGFPDAAYDVTLARTFPTGQTTPTMDPGGARPGDTTHLFLAPDPVFPERAYRSPSYIFLSLGHQMTHVVVRRLFAEHPELVERSVRLREAVEASMVRSGYESLFADETVGEQLARAITVRIMSRTSPSILWAARTEALNANMALVPWLEAALERYEAARDRYSSLSAFAGELAKTLDSIPMDTCRASPSPGVALVAAGRNRAVVGWLAPASPFRAKGLALGDTVVSVDDDSVSAGGLLIPTRQLLFAFSDHLPSELASIDFRRGGRTYSAQLPIAWVARATVRVASQAPAPRAAGAELPICPWVRRALRP